MTRYNVQRPVTFEEKKDLTADQAERILTILAEGTEVSKEVLYDEHQ